MINKDFYKHKPILVTGGDGFIGSHLVKRLVKMGGKVLVLTHSKNLLYLDKIKNKLEKVIPCDIIKKEEVKKIDDDLDVIFHLAADISVSDSIKNPEKTRITNVTGTKNILDLAMEKNVRKFVYVSTSAVYDWSDNPINEESRIKPSNPYGKTKLEGENLCLEYKKKFALNIAIPRLFNVYGVGQQNDSFALFIKNALNNKNITIEGEGNQKRDFINVKDVVSALLLMGSEELPNTPIVNFGTGKGTKIIALAEKIIKMSNSSSKIVNTMPRENDGSSVCDYNKAKKLLKWEPKIMINEDLKEMIEWAKGGYHNG